MRAQNPQAPPFSHHRSLQANAHFRFSHCILHVGIFKQTSFSHTNRIILFQIQRQFSKQMLLFRRIRRNILVATLSIGIVYPLVFDNLASGGRSLLQYASQATVLRCPHQHFWIRLMWQNTSTQCITANNNSPSGIDYLYPSRQSTDEKQRRCAK